MNQPIGYPKPIWVLTRAEVVVEDNKEVINHDTSHLIGGTFDAIVAEKMAAVLKQHQSLSTMIRSEVNPLPEVILDALPNKAEDPEVDKLLSMVDL